VVSRNFNLGVKNLKEVLIVPCTDGGPSPRDTIREENSRLDVLLCSACRALERLGYDFDENPELSRWWDQHKREDEAREQVETRKRLRKSLAKELANIPVSHLTKEERQILREEGYL
jgi:hypothetical protein